jgi:predicted RNase H-like HicB family nuclease
MSRYKVVYERDSAGWWVASVPSIHGCHTQGRTVEEARRRIREALSLFVEDAETAELLDAVMLPAGLARHLKRLRVARQRAQREAANAQLASKQAARALRQKMGLSVRDTARILGLSHQRIHQLGR